MMKAVKQSEGFTLVELMVGMLASSILALIVGIMLFNGWLHWRRSSESVAMQRNAVIAVRILEHRIRNADLNDIGGWGNGPITFAADPDFLSTDISPGAEAGLVANSFVVQTNNSGGVEVSFNLQTSSGADAGSYTTTIYPRNRS